MATIRKVTPSGGISEFRGAAPEAGGGFRLLAAGFDALYDRVLPKAIAEETEKGAALGREMAKQQIGGNGQVYASSAGGNGRYRDAIASIESAGSGDYSAVGPTHATMGRALGRYQIMEANIGPWSQEALGRKVTADEFLKNPAIQDAIFDHKFGGYVAQYGEAGAAQAWFAGPGGVGKTDRTDVLGTSVGEYGDKFMRALGGTVTASSSGADPAFTPTMLKDADGNLVQRLYDPSSDPIKQAFNMAAGADYQAQVFLKSSVDLMAMREQFALDPAGFKGAADAYLDGIVEKAPDLFKGDIRAGLAKEAQQVFLGIIDDQHRDIQQRAANSNGALIDKWSDSLGAAIAGGDPKEIAAARSNLDAALTVRERLPGLAWTSEQSAEVHRKAAEDGQRRIQDGQNKMISGWKSTLKTIVDAAKAGMSAAGEEILDNPNVLAALPDEAREALAFTTLRDQMPSFMKMPPKEQAAALAEMKQRPVQFDWETDLFGAAEKAAAANAEAWAKDPIKRAGEVLENKPAPMPDLANIEALPAWLEGRAAYGQSLADQGFTPKPVFVSAEEATALGALFGKDVPADLKLGALTAVVGAMGENASGFFDQINMSDKTVRAAGMALAAGVDPRVAEDALVGRQRLDEGIIQSPEDKAVMGAFDDGMRTAVMSVPGASAMMGEMKDLAISIYAATVPQNATSGQQKDAMAEAWKRALGQTSLPTGTRGGVQDVGGNPAWLAPSMSGPEIDEALKRAIGVKVVAGYTIPVGPDLAMWEAVSGGKQPAVDGAPLTPAMFIDGQIAISPEETGRNLYRLQIVHSNGSRSDVRVMGSDAPFIFDAEALVAMSRTKQ